MPTDLPPPWVLDRREAIGRTIRETRTRARLSQERLAEMVDADRKTINRIEYAVTDPPLSLLLRIARALGVSLSELVRE
ncbi:helix-turn-helix transcriptional regulator [Streptomyces sp. NPDC004838]